jgi:hypothetical protein
MRDEAGDVLRRDFVQSQAGKFRISFQIRDAIFVEANRVGLGRLRGADERQEVLFHELPKDRNRLLVSNADFALGERCLVRRLDLLSDSFIRLLSALPDRFPVPYESIPPDAAAFVDCHCYAPAFPTGHDMSRVLRAQKSRLEKMRIRPSPSARQSPLLSQLNGVNEIEDAKSSALLTQRNIEEAARAAGVGTRTLIRWLKLPDFGKEYRKARREAVHQSVARMQQATGAVASVVLKLMTDPNVPGP